MRWHDYRPEPEMKAVRLAVNRIGEDLFPLYLEVQRADVLAQSLYRREEKLGRLAAVGSVTGKSARRGSVYP